MKSIRYFLLPLALTALAALATINLDAAKRRGDENQEPDSKTQITGQHIARGWCSFPSLVTASIDCLSTSLQDEATWFDDLDDELEEVARSVVKQQIKKAYFLDHGTFFRDERVEIDHEDLYEFGYITHELKTIVDTLNDSNVHVSIQAHQALVDNIRTLSQDQIQALYNQLVGPSTFKMALRFVDAQKFQVNLDGLDCVEFVNNTHKWVNSFSLEATPFFSQTHLQYVLPLLEALIDAPVVELDLSKNQLTQLPEQIGNLVNLQALYLYNNQLTYLPDSIGNLDKLQWLTLFNNQLIQIPDQICNLVNLQNLFLGVNQLTQLPEQIGNLVNLEAFGLASNPFPDDVKEALRQQFGHLGDNFKI